jgi:hypothetical protein
MFYSSGSDTDISDIIIDNNIIFSTAILSQGFNNLQSFNKYNMSQIIQGALVYL